MGRTDWLVRVALYAIRRGEQVSKREAASWAQREFPRWADLIRRALDWRQHQWEPERPDGTATIQQTRAFVAEMTKLAEE